MLVKCLWSFFFLICYSFVFLSEAKSQQVADVKYRFDQDTIAVTVGKTFSNKISISNLTDRTIELSPSADGTMSLLGLIKLPQRIVLKAHEEKSYPLKYIADRSTIKSSIQAFIIGFTTSDPSVRLPESIFFYSKLETDRTLVLQTEQPEYYLDLSTNQLQFLVQASNMGLVPITFKLVFSGYPPGFVVTGEMTQITLQPGAQTLLPFTVSMRSKTSIQDFDLTMQGIDEGGSILSSRRIRILQVGSVKNFGGFNDFQNVLFNNTVGFRYLSMGQGSSIYQLQGYGDLDLTMDRKLKYRLNLDYFQDQSALNAYDTYVDYQEKDWSIKVGNIYENLDQTISGRGVKASYMLGKDRSISLYGVENNYMLFSQVQQLIPGATVIGLNYAVQSNADQGSFLTYLHSNNDYRELNSDLISGKTRFQISPKQQLGVEGGYSLERTNQRTIEPAFALGTNYQYSSEGIQIASINYFSSPYYTGLRRGVIQSDSRVSKLLKNNQSIAARISYLDNNPKYQAGDKSYFFNNLNRIQIYELGYHVGLGQFQLDIRPYLMIQQATAYKELTFLTGAPEYWRSSSIRSIGDISFFSPAHRFSVRTDYGYTYRNTSHKPLAPFHSLRVTGNYSNQYVGFNTFIQINPYYLNDLLASNSDAKYRIYSFGPSSQFRAFKGSLQTQVSTMYSYYSTSNSHNLSINGNAKWQLKGNWNLTADVFYTFMQNRIPLYVGQGGTAVVSSFFDNSQIRIGIEKNFAVFMHSKGLSLELSFFDDQNNNGVRDKGESTPAGIVVKIDRNVASTNGRGRVKFLNMEVGSYDMQLENNQGWVVQGQTSIVLTKNQRLDIPLVKARVLKGKIKLVSDKYLQTNPELAGIRINIIDAYGKIYSTLSDSEGNFTFYLPIGRYTASIPTVGMSFSIENPIQVLYVNGENTQHLVDFRYKDERRKVGIKRF